MNPIEHAILAARWRLLLQNGLRILGGLLLICCGFVTLLVLADKLLAVVTPLGVHIAAVALALLVTSGITWWRCPGRREVAVLIDQRLGLKDQLGTALFASSKTDDPMAHRVVHDAQLTATNMPLASAFPVHLSRVWGYLFPSVVVLAALVMFLPRMDLVGRSHAQSQVNDQLLRVAQTKQQLLAVKKAVAAIDHVEVGEARSDSAGFEPGDISADDLLSQVMPRDVTAPGTPEQTAVNLSRLRDQLTDLTHQQQQLLDQVQNIMTRLNLTRTGPADRFTEALTRGDFQASQEAMDDLAELIQSMNDSQRQALRQQLEELAQQLDQSSQQLAQKEQDAQKQIEKLLEDTPVSRQEIEPGQPNELTINDHDPQHDGGLDRPQSEQRIVQQLQHQQRRSRQSRQFCQEVSKGLSEASRSAGERSNSESDRDETAGRPFERISRELSRMAQVHRQISRTGQAQRQVEQALDGLLQSSRDSPERTSGGNRINQENGIGPYPVNPSRVVQGRQTEGQTEAIVSYSRDHANIVNINGESTVKYDQEVARARQQAEQAVTEERVPRRYHQIIRDYFNRLPLTNDSAGVSSSPQ